ncbi:MAG: TIGR04013 family B12-binding domain/radical SAM domain-containing protein [Myxococcota bacterium]
MRPVSLIFSFRAPGKYAFTALAGAVESQADLSSITLHFPRRFEDLERTTRDSLALGHRVVVAWSFYSPSLPECAEELRLLRERVREDFLAIAGGVHATAEPLETLRAGFDQICIGEGELALTELLRRLLRDEDASTTPGFARLLHGRVVQNPRPPRIELDDFPPFAPAHRRFGAIELTRGCIYACRFCQTPFFSKARFRHRSAGNTARWAKALAQAAKPDVRFVSPTSLSYGSQDEGVNLAAVEELLAKVREAVGPSGRIFFGTFPSEVRPEHVTPEALAVLRRYVDNDNLVIGGQSGSERVLEASRRGHDVEAIVRAVRVSVEAGFRPNVDFILGLPGEEPEDVHATVTLMRRLAALGARVHGHTFMPLPGTPFRDAPPGNVDDETRADLDRLASEQRLYGHWKAQLRTARELARRRDAARTA